MRRQYGYLRSAGCTLFLETTRDIPRTVDLAVPYGAKFTTDFAVIFCMTPLCCTIYMPQFSGLPTSQPPTDRGSEMPSILYVGELDYGGTSRDKAEALASLGAAVDMIGPSRPAGLAGKLGSEAQPHDIRQSFHFAPECGDIGNRFSD